MAYCTGENEVNPTREEHSHISIRRGHYLHGYVYRFIELCFPSLNEQAVRAGVRPELDVNLTVEAER